MNQRSYADVPKVEFGFINLLRGPAALLVVYSHFVGGYLDSLHQTFWLKHWVDVLITKPLAIVMEFGQLGVMIFFLVSGFIITHVARAETGTRFVLRRVFRVYPTYWFVLAVSYVLWSLGLPVAGETILSPSGFHLIDGWGDVLRVVSITNYIYAPQHVIMGVAWSLQVEVIFYAVIFLLTPLVRRAPTFAMLIELALVASCIATAKFGDSWFLFAANMAYLPYLLIGQAIYFYWAGGLSGSRAMLLGWLAYFTAVYGIWQIHTSFLDPASSRTLCLVFALGIFSWAMVYGDVLGKRALARWLSDISYPIYLVHGTVGVLLLIKLHPFVGYGNALLISLGAVFLLASGIHRLIEKPSIELGRKCSNFFSRGRLKAATGA